MKMMASCVRTSVVFYLVVLLTLTAFSTRGSAQIALSQAPAGWDADVKLDEAPDRNADANIVEIDLRAELADVQIAPGKVVHAWTYNGGLPGPLIRARVGDRLIVHFKNDLPEPTTVHWHGVRVPIEMDGVPGISQDEVKRGETFTYDFVLRDAGLYWYHPHVMSAAQVGFGLYGALLVEDPADGVGIADQLTLVLSDIGFDDHGNPEPPDSGGSAGMVFGREGSYLLVNGKQLPTVHARAGAPQRWRIVNAAKSRFFLLELEGGQPFTIIGGDGGLQERPITDKAVLVTPGERVDVIVTPKGTPGQSLVLRALLYNRGYGSVEYRNDEPILTVALDKQPPLTTFAMPKVQRSIEPPTTAGAMPVNVVLTLPPVDVNRHSEFRVNGVARPFLAKLGQTQLWTVKNDTQWDHPFHLHGFFFIVLDDNGAPLRPLAWKDTVNIPMNTTARFLVTFDERPGNWMFHCHILDHADGGLMGTVQVGEVNTTEHVHHVKH
jgi:FtsP/CotA-like multicopper oxidase with cupredoxin domain